MNIIFNLKVNRVIQLRKKVAAGIMIVPFFFLISSFSIYAKVNSVQTKADTNQIRIGEQFKVNLTANITAGTKINFPFLTDTFNNFEIVTRGKIDTISPKDSTELTLRQQLILTSFDSGYFVIPPFYFTQTAGNKTDSFSTEAMLITVISVPVDTTKEIKALKNIINVPFPWQDYLIYLILVIALCVLIYYLYKRFKRKEKPVFIPKIPERPAHEIALEGLKRIESEKLWQQGFTKKYYSELTEIIRQYIERRFSINAMEQTTDEILKHFDASLIPSDTKEKLGFILRQADMVKFAKAQPFPTENENSMTFAYEFIHVTRPVVKADLEKQEVTP